MPRRNVLDLLDEQEEKPLRRGKGFQLSTEVEKVSDTSPNKEAGREVEQSPIRDTAKSRNREITPEKPRRIKRGYELREDLITAVKVRAAQERRKVYELMEEALETYLATQK